jgi:hydroxypyruvate isomerase
MYTTDGLKFTANLSLLFPQASINERAELAVEAGFDAAEFWWPFATSTPTDVEVSSFVSSIKGSGIRLTGLNFAAGNMPQGDRGLISDPTQIETFKQSVEILVHIAKETGVRMFNLLYGNTIEGVSADSQEGIARENVRYAQEKVAKALGATILIEQCNPRENSKYRLAAPEDAIKVINELNAESPNTLGLLADVYHYAESGNDPVSLINKNFSIIRHVQIADSPGRNEPGTGSVDFAGVFEALIKNNYNGYIGLEYRPAGDTAEGLSWLS